jgi:spore coat polysaccharide biosynthesis protein SpsF (cytidylyltransferase family)
VAGIQARSGSSRLPRKVLADLAGRSLIERVVERTRRAELVDEVVVLTSNDPSDDELAALLEARAIPVRRGPLADVLARYMALLAEFEPEHVVRVTGDCPLLEPDFIDLQLDALRAFDADLVHVAADDSGAVEGTLGGQGALSARALRQALASTDPRDREHVGSFLFRGEPERFRFVEVEVDPGYHRPGLRLAVDEPADLALVRRVFEVFGERPFTTLEALSWLEAAPEGDWNAGVRESADNRAVRALARARRVRPVGVWP